MEKYYKVLKLPNTAKLTDLDNARNRLLKIYHPDIYQGNKSVAVKRTKEILEAYENLKLHLNNSALNNTPTQNKKTTSPKENFYRNETKKKNPKNEEKIYIKIKKWIKDKNWEWLLWGFCFATIFSIFKYLAKN